jgi:large subunit ribosomal protein L30
MSDKQTKAAPAATGGKAAAKAKPAAKAKAAGNGSAGKKIRVTLVKGLRGTLHTHRESVKGLGLRHRQHTVEVQDTPAIRGMINKVSYLLKVED